MRKKQLMVELRDSQERVRELEELICPAESHQWKVYTLSTRYLPDIDCMEHTYSHICTKCRKRKTSINIQ